MSHKGLAQGSVTHDLLTHSDASFPLHSVKNPLREEARINKDTIIKKRLYAILYILLRKPIANK